MFISSEKEALMRDALGGPTVTPFVTVSGYLI
jgi:hypothetical protein